MRWDTLVAVPVLALLSAGICVGQTQRPAPDPVQRAVTTARNEGRLTDAEKLLQDAIHDLEQNDPQSPRLPQYLRELAALLGRAGRSAEAAVALQQAYEIDRNALGPNDLRLTVDITNLAWTAQRMGDTGKAEQLFNQALEITRANEANLQTVPEAGMAAGTFGTMLSFYMAEKRWIDAELLMQEEEKLCGLIPQPYRGGYGCNISGMYEQIYRGEGRNAEADQVRLDDSLPPDFAALEHAARKYQDDGVYPSAEETYNRAIALAQKLSADPQGGHEGLEIREMDLLGQLYEKEGSNDRAEKIYMDAYELTRKRAGPEPNQKPYASALNAGTLVNLYCNEGRFKDAERLLQSVLDIKIADLGERHRSSVDTLVRLASVFEQDGRKDKSQNAQARALYERAIQIQEQNLGPNHPQLVPLLQQYEVFLESVPDAAKAAEVRARIAAISASKPQP